MKKKQSKVVQYNRWGYYFLIPFIVVYLLFQFVPLVTTIYNSFFENYRSGLKQIGPNFIGLGNYLKILSNADLWKYAGNTMIMWIMISWFPAADHHLAPPRCLVYGSLASPSRPALL